MRAIHPRNSVAVQLALTVVKESAKNPRIAILTNAALYSLAFDDVEYRFMEARRHMMGLDGDAKDTVEALADWKNELIKERLAELEALECQVEATKGTGTRTARSRR